MKKQILLIIITIITSIPTEIKSALFDIIDPWQRLTSEVEPIIKEACIQYLNNKGFENISLRELHKMTELGGSYMDLNIPSNTYACTRPPHRTIFLSPEMVNSIKKNIDNNEPISIYDKFVLLHEMGHLYPYGCEHPLLLKRSNELTIIINSFPVAVEICACCGLGGVLTWMLYNGDIIAAKLFMKKEYDHKILDSKNQLSYKSLAAWLCVLTAAIVNGYFRRNAFQKELSDIQQKISTIQQSFKKWTFSHQDKSIEKHVKDQCEELDADQFALNLLSIQELEDLYIYISQFNTAQAAQWYSRECQNAIHASPKDYCLAITAEMERRKTK